MSHSRRRDKTVQTIAHCEFCGEPGVTAEHFLPKWLDNVMEARTPHDIRHQTKSYADNSPEGPIWQIIPSTKPGHARRKKVRAFCRPCNSGWMRSIQDEAKPILAPLILGKSVKLQSSDMEVIAKWMTMTTMAGEVGHRETVSIPETQRRK